MLCHECIMKGEERGAAAICRFCQVGLCKEHLVALYREPSTVPQYSCNHNPAGRPQRPLPSEVEVYPLEKVLNGQNGHKVPVHR